MTVPASHLPDKTYELGIHSSLLHFAFKIRVLLGKPGTLDTTSEGNQGNLKEDARPNFLLYC